jgi:hypothetical protein
MKEASDPRLLQGLVTLFSYNKRTVPLLQELLHNYSYFVIPLHI